MLTTTLVLVVVLALAFDFTNGFHDAANAIASAVSTRALSLRGALTLAAVMNLIGALLGTGVAVTIASGVIDTPVGQDALHVVLSALVGAIAWNLLTWYFGLPSSSSHALVGGLVGAAVASSTQVHWAGVVEKVVIPMIVSPAVGLVLGYAVMTAIMWAFRHADAHRAGRLMRRAQIVSAASLALGHGLQDAQKSMGVIVLALVVTGHQAGYAVPLWVILACALALTAGTYSGGLRIMRTLGRRIFHLTPPHGFAAELSAASVLYLTAFVFAAPVSTTHVITSAVMGAGATTRRSAVRWSVAGDIAKGWVLTLPGAAVVAAATYGVTGLL
ncbi:inorganic phosphate transporter [Goodfellowiella coeruleoviolacea]|uniref:Inorganic phosphate transporter, PiT family n=1 Tax=Goodfellowiella coeruleoviolacea TaxID=334858 RepID=A0AAE3GHG3_9PSEU|nr:inorganic phosphate transporter [Goodfellowiella coeruleoviolacea]MCP2167454.1 inorganic phosphate transporter, PiT family [Goodfellowiella coeruleoviolacea]